MFVGVELCHPEQMDQHVELMPPRQLDQIAQGLGDEGGGLVRPAIAPCFVIGETPASGSLSLPATPRPSQPAPESP